MRRILLALFVFLALSRPAAAAPSYLQGVDAMMANYTAADRFSGAVLVAKDGKPVFRKAYGLANREWGVAATPETRFRLGSITKQFTATAILQLAEQGKLSLDDPISKYYAAAPAAWSGITLKHLLTHTSGIPSYTAIPGFFEGGPSRLDRTPAEIVALTQDKPLEFQPGARFAYDNTGYILLGYVVEKVSGEPYAAYLQAHIFGPLGLKNTGYDVTETLLPKRASGYTLRKGQVINAPYLAMSLPYAAGSLYSTVDDLLAWDQALHAGKVLKPASVQAMFTDYGFKYGFGQFYSEREGRPFWGHNGGINGFVTLLGRYPDAGLTLVVLSNFEEAPIGRIGSRLGELYFHPERGDGPQGKPTTQELGRYVGRYQLAEDAVLQVTQENGRLFAQRTGGGKLELFREVGTTYFVNFPPAYYSFAAGDRAAQVTVSQAGKDLVAKRID